ncbi:MAG: hypothetical protein BWK79_09780 [Beggiatoa sp. IS2]|nr:MAG: hypothetical protein BWK79_09780 [Beggiatoa sp. IS2]
MKKYVLILYFLICQTVTAQTDLYDALVPVNSRDETARIEATKQALLQVLIRLSGNRELANKPAIKAKLAQAERLAQQFTYKNRPEDGQLLLSVGFDPDDLDELMNTLSIPQWNSNHATCLVWIILENSGQPTVVNLDEQPKIVNILQDQAWQRGLSVIFPLLDLEDMTTLKKFADTPNSAQETWQSLMTRYRVEILLVARLSQTSAWEGQWHLYLANKELSNWQDRQEQQNTLLGRGLDKAVDTLASQTITIVAKESVPTPVATAKETAPTPVVTTPTEKFTLQVTNVPNFEDYIKLREYLHGLGIITDLQVQSMQTGQITFLIAAQGGKAAVAQAISSGRVLVLIAAKEMIYRFVR